MKKVFKILIRLLALPGMAIITIIPHLIGYLVNLSRFMRYGGEATVYTKKDKESIASIYRMIESVYDESKGGDHECV